MCYHRTRNHVKRHRNDHYFGIATHAEDNDNMKDKERDDEALVKADQNKCEDEEADLDGLTQACSFRSPLWKGSFRRIIPENEGVQCSHDNFNL